MRRLGVDPGSVRTGLAVADDEVPVATPLKTLSHKSPSQAAAGVAAVVRSEAIDEVVIGLPLAMDGREGEAARKARRFGQALGALVPVPIVFWDERLSTASALRSLRTQGVRNSTARAVVDQAAAVVLLQSFLDAHDQRPISDDGFDDT